MPAGTYNHFRQMGRVVENPRHVVRLADSDRALGGDLRGVSVETAAEYLLHRVRGVTLGEMTGYLKREGHPDVVFETDDGTRRFTWSAADEDYQPAA